VQDIDDTTDPFDVYDNGNYIFTTSDPFDGGFLSPIGNPNNPDEAALHSEFSRGTFMLKPGYHDISGTNIRPNSSDFGGGAFIRVDTISEPASLPLILLGILVIAYRHVNCATIKSFKNPNRSINTA